MKPAISKNIFLIFLLAAAVIGIAVFLIPRSSRNPDSTTSSLTSKDNNLNIYTSNSSKVSFMYPKNWSIDDKYPFVLLANYSTNLNTNKKPDSEQVEIIIKEASLCQENIEKNIVNGGCGENQKVLNIIQKKEISTLSSGNTFYKFLVKYPDKSAIWSYYLEKGDKILQISKTPDPSQFEKEFEDLVSSIRFID